MGIAFQQFTKPDIGFSLFFRLLTAGVKGKQDDGQNNISWNPEEWFHAYIFWGNEDKGSVLYVTYGTDFLP